MRSGEIDALRWLAMTMVVALHCELVPFGWMGVWLFYAISGFVVTLSILDRHPAESKATRLRDFAARRIVRIVPIYYGYIALGLIVTTALGLRQDPLTVASLFGFFNNWAMVAGIGRLDGWDVGHLWTLSTEMQFYALYGVALCVLPRRATLALLAAMLCAGPLLRLAVSSWLTAHQWEPLAAAFAVYAGPGLHFDSFAMGGLLAFAQARGGLTRLARPLAGAGLAALAAYALAYMLVNRLVLDRHGVQMIRDVVSGILFGQYREVPLYAAVGLFATGLIALAATRDTLAQWLLRQPALQWIGRMSYGGYLYHVIGLQLFTAYAATHLPAGLAARLLFRIAGFAFVYALTILIAWLSFRFVEQPIARAAGRRRRAAAPHLGAAD